MKRHTFRNSIKYRVAEILAGVVICGALVCPWTTSAWPASQGNDVLQAFAAEFWEWRERNQPFNADDIPRIEHPAGQRDWSAASIAKQRANLAQFEARWKQMNPSGWPVPQQVDYRLMGSALARVRWELDM